MKRRLALTSLAMVTALTLAACSDDGDSSEDANEDETTSQETPTDEPTEEPTDEVTETPTEEPTDVASETATEEAAAEPPAGDLTEPGAELALGESATVNDSDEKLVFELSVDKFEKATPAERKQLGGDATKKKYEVWYVHTTGTLVSGKPDGYDPALHIEGLAGDTQTGDLIKFGTFAPCENNDFEEGDQPGTKVTTCTIVMSESGKVDGAMYSDSSGDYSVFDGTEVTWR